jgi:hypothetical protein
LAKYPGLSIHTGMVEKIHISVYSRMALYDPQIRIPPPGKNHTLCFYAFGKLAVCPLKDKNSCSQVITVRTKGYHCIVVENTDVKVSFKKLD